MPAIFSVNHSHFKIQTSYFVFEPLLCIWKSLAIFSFTSFSLSHIAVLTTVHPLLSLHIVNKTIFLAFSQHIFPQRITSPASPLSSGQCVAEQIWGAGESLKCGDKSSRCEQVPPLPISDSLKLSQVLEKVQRPRGRRESTGGCTHLVWRLGSSLELQFLKTPCRSGKSRLLLKWEQDGSRCWGFLQQEQITAVDFGHLWVWSLNVVLDLSCLPVHGELGMYLAFSRLIRHTYQL